MPVIICVGAIGTDEVLRLAEDAQEAGANALLLPALSYQALKDEEVFGLFETMASAGVLGLTDTDCLPRPVRPLTADDIAEVAAVIRALGLR